MYVGLWSRLAALGLVASLVGCHAPGNELESVRYGPDDRISESYTVAKINITYVDEHGKLHSETSEIGKYGQGYVGNANGVAVHIRATGPNGEQNHWGCSWPLLSTVNDGAFPDEPWIALIKRGNCSFETKVQNAFKANAAAVLVYNDKDSIILDKMSLSGTRNITAVFTYKWKGEEIARLVDNGTRVMIGIIKGRTTLVNSNNINKTSVLFVSISFIVLMVISLAWLVFYYIQRFRYIHAKDRLSKRLCCAAKKALSKIPVRNLKTDDREIQGDGECCAICIEPYKVSETLRSLPCRHEFHKHCIDPWLLEHRTCPMCKMDILKYYGFVFTGSQESILQLEIEEARSRTISPARNRHITLLTSDNSYEEAGSERSSRASSPDELVPSLRTCEASNSNSPQRTNNRSHTHTSTETRQDTSSSDPVPSLSPHE